MQTETRYQVEAKSDHTGETIPGTTREFRTVPEATAYALSLNKQEGQTVEAYKLTYPASRITLTLNRDQIHALYRAIKIHNMSYDGVDEEELDGTGVLEAIAELEKIETKLDRATGNN